MKRMKRWTCLVAAVFAFTVHSGSAAPPQGAPLRIISLIPAVTEMLFAMGAGAQVVAVSSFDHFPPEVDRLPKVGALVDPDLERIISLRPDLVVVYGSQLDLHRQLSRAKIPVYQLLRRKKRNQSSRGSIRPDCWYRMDE